MTAPTRPNCNLCSSDLILMRDALKVRADAQRMVEHAEAVVAFVTAFLFKQYNLPPDAVIDNDGSIRLPEEYKMMVDGSITYTSEPQ